MTTLATFDLDWADIQAILGDTGDASLQELCMHANVEPLGLDPDYCPGGGPTTRYNNLRTAPYNMGYFRGYMSPNNYIMIIGYADAVVYRCVLGETLHSTKLWDAGWQYYTGTAFTDWEFAHGLRVCHTEDWDDPACTYGWVNNWVYGPVSPGSPAWNYRFEDRDSPIPAYIYPVDPTESLPAGSYYWVWELGPHFLSEDYGEIVLSMPLTIADYLLSDPDEFTNFSSGGGSSHFHVWTGLYSNSVAISGGVYLTGATNGTGNRQQDFTIPNNTTGFPITHHILTTASGQPSSHVYIYQLA
jgi:hypothetical protein